MRVYIYRLLEILDKKKFLTISDFLSPNSELNDEPSN